MHVAITCGNSPIMADVVDLIRRVPGVSAISLLDTEIIEFNLGCRTFKVPKGNHVDYTSAVKSICDQNTIDFIFVCSDEEALALSATSWAKNISHLDSKDRIELVLNKLDLHSALSAELVPAFGVWSSKDELKSMVSRFGAVIERPTTGRGSRGLRYIVRNKLRGADRSACVEDVIPSQGVFHTQYLSGDKYSADCLFERGEVLTCMIRNNGKEIKYNPPTMAAVAVVDQDVFAFASRVGRELNLSGFHQIECGKDELGKVKLIEINPRLDATLPITRCYTENFYEVIISKKALGLMHPVQPTFRRFFQAAVR